MKFPRCNVFQNKNNHRYHWTAHGTRFRPGWVGGRDRRWYQSHCFKPISVVIIILKLK
ncbi:hypothetical protein HanXRQr2_Chr04g0180321 [Helianthus annuus]|uniref:Uncharacterized protein n=1 Tax=Helianthus annuus TaxID=4232 RepID=A0A9K3NSB7_HELAN|nr:hypothetical protein HanXRQr2_Chr04g0180321 [Helianthus annuus]KAJ0932447.1 hypothetical protein HanPSC8_Chr04g0173741 [Helianthus annuus]